MFSFNFFIVKKELILINFIRTKPVTNHFDLSIGSIEAPDSALSNDLQNEACFGGSFRERGLSISGLLCEVVELIHNGHRFKTF